MGAARRREPGRRHPHGVGAGVSWRGSSTALADRFGIAPDAEVSIEANPEDWDPGSMGRPGRPRLHPDLAGCPVVRPGGPRRPGAEPHAGTGTGGADRRPPRRLRLGVARPGVRRLHRKIRARWAATVATALALEPDHLSGYALTVERGTELSRQVTAGTGARTRPGRAGRRLRAAGRRSRRRRALALRGVQLRPARASLPVQPRHLGAGRVPRASGSAPTTTGTGPGAATCGGWTPTWSRWNGANAPGPAPRLRRSWGREQERLMLGLRRRAGVVAGPIGDVLLASGDGRRLVDAGVLGRRRPSRRAPTPAHRRGHPGGARPRARIVGAISSADDC